MDFFDNDQFEEIVREFFGQSGNQKRRRRSGAIIEGEGEERTIDFVEYDGRVYIIFELSGYDEKDVVVLVDKDELEIRAVKNESDSSQSYLLPKLQRGVFYKRTLPEFVNPRKFNYKMKNGVLELVFEKKR